MKGQENQEELFQLTATTITTTTAKQATYCLHELSNEFSSMNFLTLTHGNSSAICDQI